MGVKAINLGQGLYEVSPDLLLRSIIADFNDMKGPLKSYHGALAAERMSKWLYALTRTSKMDFCLYRGSQQKATLYADAWNTFRKLMREIRGTYLSSFSFWQVVACGLGTPDKEVAVFHHNLVRLLYYPLAVFAQASKWPNERNSQLTTLKKDIRLLLELIDWWQCYAPIFNNLGEYFGDLGTHLRLLGKMAALSLPLHTAFVSIDVEETPESEVI